MFHHQAIPRITSVGGLCACSVLLLAAAGCYRYVPVQSHVEPGRALRVELTDQGAAALTSQLGPGVLEIEGVLLNQQENALSIAVEQYITRRQGALSGNNEAVTLTLGQLTAIQQKRVDRLRSALFGLGVGAAAFTVMQIVSRDERALEDENPEDPGNPRIRARSTGFRGLSIGARLFLPRVP